jgi:hypothetical protein
VPWVGSVTRPTALRSRQRPPGGPAPPSAVLVLNKDVCVSAVHA